MRDRAIELAVRYFEALSNEDLEAVAQVRRLSAADRAALQTAFRRGSGRVALQPLPTARADPEAGVARVLGTVVSETDGRSHRELVTLRFRTFGGRLLIVGDDRKSP